MRLRKLTPEQKADISLRKARGYSINKIFNDFYEEHSYVVEDQRHSYNSFRAYFASEEGKEAVKEARQALRDGAPVSEYTHRGERLDVLVENLGRLLTRIRMADEAPMEVSALTGLSSEIRQVIREIREEAAPYDSDADAVQSPMEQFFSQLQSLDPKVQKLVLGEEN